jgi:aminoglycoside 6'-N-acetyltransferase
MSFRLEGQAVALIPVVGGHVEELRRIAGLPEVRSRWGDEHLNPQWPFDEPSVNRLSVIHKSVVCGLIQYGEEDDPMYRHASIDIFLDPAEHGRGLGRDAIDLLARHLFFTLGHHRLVIDPAVDNEAAIRCYAAVGFRPVGVMRRYERDAEGQGWHDGLLMDMLIEDIAQRG